MSNKKAAHFHLYVLINQNTNSRYTFAFANFLYILYGIIFREENNNAYSLYLYLINLQSLQECNDFILYKNKHYLFTDNKCLFL